MDILTDLNEAQREAVRHTEGPLLLLAGAGSGKTRALTHRIGYLIREKGVAPAHILAVTFTNKAAGEMKHRLQVLVGPESRDIWARTFHSTCVQILRRHVGLVPPYTPEFSIFDETDQLVLMRQVLREHLVEERTFQPRAVLSAISRSKCDLVGPEEFAAEASGYFVENVARFYQTYQLRLAENNALDYDDLLGVAIRLFHEQPSVLAEYQDRFRYIHVDEYQDTNHSQYELARMLAEKHQNICVVGDDDQSIYSWRGADIRNILDFERDYRKTTVIHLEQNYRCTGNILAAAQEVVRLNRRRRPKDLFTANAEGCLLRLFEADDERVEAEFVCSVARASRQDGARYGDIAVFYRVNAQSRNFEDALRREDVPYQIVGGVKFYERREVKDVVAYLRLLENPRDNVSLLRIVNVPARGIGQTTVQRLEAFAGERLLSLMDAVERADEIETLNAAARRSLGRFAETMRGLRTDGSVVDIVEDVLEKSGYVRALEQENTLEAESRIENLNEFLSAAADYEEREEEPSLRGFLETITLATDVDGMEDDPDRVTLMTLHAAKGLEFRVVFITGMEEGLFPHERAMSDEVQIEEERRLCYVGMTRAMRELYLTRARHRRFQGFSRDTLRSRFLDEVPYHLVEEVDAWDDSAARKAAPVRVAGAVRGRPPSLARATRSVSRFDPEPQTLSDAEDFLRVDGRVYHARFGKGTVVAREGEGSNLRVDVAFDDGSVKRLLAEFARLEPA
jgi:DNA helicase-2/ATP-dependent DNA helicase PcrA